MLEWFSDAKQYLTDEELEEFSRLWAPDLSTAEMVLYTHMWNKRYMHTGLAAVLPSLISAPPSVAGQLHIDSISMSLFKRLI